MGKACFEDQSELLALLALGNHPDMLDGGGRPLAWSALMLKSKACLEILLEAGADPNLAWTGDDGQERLLMWACGAGDASEMVELLVEAGAEVGWPSEDDQKTPLILACWRGDARSSRLLIEKGADVEHRDCNGASALHYAATGHGPQVQSMAGPSHPGNIECMGLLAAAGANLDAADHAGWRPMHWAAHNGRTGHAAALCEKGADAFAVDHQGRSPAAIAREQGLEGVAMLIESSLSKQLRDQISGAIAAQAPNAIDAPRLRI